MRKRIIILVLLAAAFGLIYGWWRLINSRTYQVFGEIVPRVETSEKVIALTFDDGPTPEFTDEILQILKEADIKSTFFLCGFALEHNPAEGKKIADAGHEIGNHSFSHDRMVFVSPSWVKSEIERTDDLIRATGYTAPTHFRPPYGKKFIFLPYYLSQNGRKTITWDVEPETYAEIAKSPENIIDHVLNNTTNGAIILLHIMYDSDRKSMKAVRPIIDGLKAKGFRFVTVTELTEKSGR